MYTEQREMPFVAFMSIYVFYLVVIILTTQEISHEKTEV